MDLELSVKNVATLSRGQCEKLKIATRRQKRAKTDEGGVPNLRQNIRNKARRGGRERMRYSAKLVGQRAVVAVVGERN